MQTAIIPTVVSNLLPELGFNNSQNNVQNNEDDTFQNFLRSVAEITMEENMTEAEKFNNSDEKMEMAANEFLSFYGFTPAEISEILNILDMEEDITAVNFFERIDLSDKGVAQFFKETGSQFNEEFVLSKEEIESLINRKISLMKGNISYTEEAVNGEYPIKGEENLSPLPKDATAIETEQAGALHNHGSGPEDNSLLIEGTEIIEPYDRGNMPESLSGKEIPLPVINDSEENNQVQEELSIDSTNAYVEIEKGREELNKEVTHIANNLEKKYELPFRGKELLSPTVNIVEEDNQGDEELNIESIKAVLDMDWGPASMKDNIVDDTTWIQAFSGKDAETPEVLKKGNNDVLVMSSTGKEGIESTLPLPVEAAAGEGAFKPDKVFEDNVIKQVTGKISSIIRNGKKGISLRLNPPSLGAVEVKIQKESKLMKISILTENQFVKSVIESNLPELRQSLADQGIVADQFNVTVRGGDDNSGGREQRGWSNSQPWEESGVEKSAIDPVINMGIVKSEDVFGNRTINLFV